METLSYVHGASNKNLLGETIGGNLKRIVEKFGNSEALVSVHQNYRATYKQFYEETGKLAKALLANNINNGDRVGIWAPNCYEWVLLQFATARIGVILVNLNPAYRAHEVSFAINQSETKLVVSALNFKKSDYKQMLTLVKEDCPSLEKIVYLNENWDNFLKKRFKNNRCLFGTGRTKSSVRQSCEYSVHVRNYWIS